MQPGSFACLVVACAACTTAIHGQQVGDRKKTAQTDAGEQRAKAIQIVQKLGGRVRSNRVDLSSTAVTDADLAHVAKPEGLIRLDVSNTSITDAGMAALTVIPA